MGKDKRPRRVRTDPLMRHLRPDPAEVLIAWSNLVGAMILTMQDEDCGNDTIHGFLDHLDMANMQTFDGGMLDFVLHVTTTFRGLVPSND